MIVVASNPRLMVVTCKKNKGGTQKLPKYVTYTETEKLKKSSNKKNINPIKKFLIGIFGEEIDYDKFNNCLLYTSPSPRDATLSRMPSSA